MREAVSRRYGNNLADFHYELYLTLKNAGLVEPMTYGVHYMWTVATPAGRAWLKENDKSKESA